MSEYTYTYTLLEEVRPVARRRHWCDYCGESIQAGTRYVRRRYVEDGEACTYKAHEACWEAMAVGGEDE
jgi:hypothetical protein